MENKVNLFIVGAAKCATTSIYHYLMQHPDVFFPNLKEPRFFSSKYYKYPLGGIKDFEYTERFIVKTLAEYENLYSNANAEKIIGDASVDYLYNQRIAEDIHKYNRNAKIIIVLRNPIERAYSHYNHLVRDGREKYSFREALSLEDIRKIENFEFSWHYLSVGMYYKQVESYLKYFGKEQVLIVLFEELVSNTQKECQRIIDFLGISFDSVANISFPLINKTGIPMIQSVTDIINKPSFLKSILKRVISQNVGMRIKGFLNRKTLSTKKLPLDCEHLLKENLLDDILKLEKLISRDLINIWNINAKNKG